MNIEEEIDKSCEEHRVNDCDINFQSTINRIPFMLTSYLYKEHQKE